jgi:extradiol dioxygenase family protein
MAQALFHLAFPVANVDETTAFYVDGLGCQVGRQNDKSVILNLYGHQLVAHVTREPLTPQKGIYPRHFGLVFEQESDWEALLERSLRANLEFYQPPKRRFPNSPLEHRTFFLRDPFHNLLEFKYYCHPSAIFGEAALQAIGDATG